MKNDNAGNRPAEILVIEDNEDDVMLTRLAFKQASVAVRLHHVGDGEEGMAFLRKQREYAAMPTPDLILLDLNMPRKDGREVLTEIAADERLRHLPVIILTTSAAQRDIIGLYRLRANSYIVKPIDFARFQHTIRSLHEYWFGVVALPGDEPEASPG
ncbi:MAG: response regulator [Gammaproteobacteria bacterium]